jgi:hypothetical protein
MDPSSDIEVVSGSRFGSFQSSSGNAFTSTNHPRASTSSFGGHGHILGGGSASGSHTNLVGAYGDTSLGAGGARARGGGKKVEIELSDRSDDDELQVTAFVPARSVSVNRYAGSATALAGTRRAD